MLVPLFVLLTIYRITCQIGICRQDDKTRRHWRCLRDWKRTMIGIMAVWPLSMVSGYVVHCTKQKTKCFLRVCRSLPVADSRKQECEILILGQTSEKKRNWDRWTSSTPSLSVEWIFIMTLPCCKTLARWNILPTAALSITASWWWALCSFALSLTSG